MAGAGVNSCCTRQLVSPGEQQERAWCLPPFGHHQQSAGLPLPSTYLMSSHHCLIRQNQVWRGGVLQRDVAPALRCLGQDKGQRLPSGAGHDATVRIRSSTAGYAKGWSSSPSTPLEMNGRISSGSTEKACMKQQVVPSRIPSLEMSLGRQGWQNGQEQQQLQLQLQRQRSVEASASKELTLLKCL